MDIGKDAEEIGEHYTQCVRPRVGRLLKLLKLDLVYARAIGDSMTLVDAGSTREIVDLLGGYGSTLLGHNHPELVGELEAALDERVPMHAQASIRPGATRVALKLNALLARYGGERRRFIVTLCNSGAEAVEAAIKHALMEWNERRRQRVIAAHDAPGGDAAYVDALSRLEPVIVAVEGSFHGKTAGSVAVTTNPEFKAMYASSPVGALFLSRGDGLEEARRKLEGCRLPAPVTRLAPDSPATRLAPDSPATRLHDFSSIAAVLFEPIQGESGIQCLSREFASTLEAVAREHGAPLVADEIQSGLFRTGSFLASHALGLKPDYVLLGKSLGGGLAKISAFLATEERYEERFGIIHTSTFAEDELSSRVALKALEILDRDSTALALAAAAFESRVRARVAQIRERCPGVLNEVRGAGFLLGVEFNFGDDAPISTLLHTIHQAGFATYVYASYLLHRHGVRLGATLSKPETLRLEPSAWISDDHVIQCLDAIEALCRLIHERRLVEITRHFWSHELPPRALETVSPLRYPPVRSPTRSPARSDQAPRKIGFLCHLIDDTHVRLMDPFLRSIGREGRERFQSKFGPMTGPVLFHEQLIEGAGGERIHLHCYGVFLPSRFFEESHLAGDGRALGQVRAMAERARRDGMELVGLGQYTSIVTRNGLALQHLGGAFTTGNGLTAAFACEAVARALAETGRTARDVRVGVLGAAGNICGVVAEILSEEAREIVLVFREGTQESERAKRTVSALRSASGAGLGRLSVATRLERLRECDVVVTGTSSAECLLRPEHLAQDAIVLDVSIPSDIDPRVFAERPDVRCYLGGRARLPLGQRLQSRWLPVPPGETYACMGETICAGLAGHTGHLSLGALDRRTVRLARDLARRVGMEMGTLKRALAPAHGGRASAPRSRIDDVAAPAQALEVTRT